MSDITDRVWQLLVDLGNTEDDVAEALIAKGIKGVPAEECNCPVYNYLASLDVPVTGVDVSHFTLAGVPGYVCLPDAVQDFIAEFDATEGDAWRALVAEVKD